MQLAPNLVVAERYRLMRKIGQGGMGSVWLATHLGLDIPCAVKFIEGEYGATAEGHSRFGREARAAAQLRSPHVVQILDHGVWQGTPYLAMELLEGEDLGQRLTRVGRLAPKELCVIVAQLSRALTKAHAAGIVHRDLKPENIFLVRDDDREIAKVLDFGIAKATGGVLDGSATKTGSMLGTPHYMSPEQAQGTKTVDHRSDLWSIAIIVYQSLTGTLPFDSEALGDLLLRIIVEPIPVPSRVAPDLPPAFDAWWAKAANRDPAQRYQTARELADSLSLVFGQSQLAERGSGSLHDHASTKSDSGLVPSMPGAASRDGLPSTLHITPQPVQMASGAAAGSSAHTFNGATVPPRRRAMYAGIAAGVTLLFLVVIVGALLAANGKGARAPSAGAVPAVAAASTGPDQPPPSPTPSAVTPEPTASTPAVASAATAAPPPDSRHPPTAPQTARPHAHANAPPVVTGKAGAAPSAKKPPGVDFGI
jgi:serine/threonine protein kinase